MFLFLFYNRKLFFSIVRKKVYLITYFDAIFRVLCKCMISMSKFDTIFQDLCRCMEYSLDHQTLTWPCYFSFRVLARPFLMTLYIFPIHVNFPITSRYFQSYYSQKKNSELFHVTWEIFFSKRCLYHIVMHVVFDWFAIACSIQAVLSQYS